jgi:undecaprenyl diphosphate synthase
LQAIEDTAHNTGMVLTVAFDYGSRAELLRAAQRARTSQQSAQNISMQDISDNLYSPTLPPVDVVVRTSGESRISNFLLWQIMGAKVYFTERTWPDFDTHEIDNALKLVHDR